MEKIWQKLYASLTEFLLGWILEYYWHSFGQAAVSWGIALGGGWGESFYYCPYISEMKCPQSRRRILDAATTEQYDPLGLITMLTLSGKGEVTYFFLQKFNAYLNLMPLYHHNRWIPPCLVVILSSLLQSGKWAETKDSWIHGTIPCSPPI